MKIVFKDFIFLNDSEIKDILELRNQKYIRENMINTDIINFENHICFINSLKTITNKKYFAIFYEEQLLGSVNFIKNEELSWGLYFKEEVNPILKSLSIYLFLDFIFEKFDEDINSFVKKINLQALNFNKHFGFKVFKEDEDFVYLKLSKIDWENQKNSKLLKPIKRYLDKIEYQFKD
ncbi:hypothetical protein [Aliarcobacter lanthieri]|uniref:hypothetical protein n=1 Tax=Aliarcobacter lanthieri TaxID=1355374 RepID=UPI003AACF780